jgi:hypothetical protein
MDLQLPQVFNAGHATENRTYPQFSISRDGGATAVLR